MRELWTSDSLGLCGWPIYDRKEAHESNAGEGGAVAHSPPWTGVVEARDEDGIVSHPEEQLNPNRSSIPRKTSPCVAQLMIVPLYLGTPVHAVAHGNITLRQWQGSRVFMRERRVLERVKWFIGPSRQFVRLLPLHTCQPTATPDFAFWYVDDSFTSHQLQTSSWIAGLYIPFTCSPRRKGRTPTSRFRSSLRPLSLSSGSTTSSSTGMRNPWDHHKHS